MPESGEAEFQLVFPPLPAKVTSIDFTEGEGVEGAFSIWGIQLKSKELPKLMLPQEAVAHPIDKNAALPAPLVQYGNTTVKGKLLDYRPCMMKELSLYLSEPSKGYADPIKTEIKRDGSFNVIFPVMGTTAATINLLGTDINFLWSRNKPANCTSICGKYPEKNPLSTKAKSLMVKLSTSMARWQVYPRS